MNDADPGERVLNSMRLRRRNRPWRIQSTGWLFVCLALLGWPGVSPSAGAETNGLIEVKAIEGTNLWVSPAGAADWLPVSAQFRHLRGGDRVRSGQRTRLTLQLPGGAVIRVPENTEFQVRPPADDRVPLWIALKRGLLYFFHRGPPGDIEVHSETARAAIRGTEFVVEVADDGEMRLSVLAGEVELRNEHGAASVRGGEQGRAGPGAAPRRTAMIESRRIIQWCLYYPAVLDLADLELSPETRTALAAPLQHYSEGDLQRALASYPPDRAPASAAEGVFLAALLLAVGQVDEAERLLPAKASDVSPPVPDAGVRSRALSEALRSMVRLVRGDDPGAMEPLLATEWLVASYAWQSRFQLDQALHAAREAVRLSPEFGVARVRVAELEFSFGRIPAALRAAEQARRHSPRHAQLLALTGYLLSADNRPREAQAEFERALKLDGALGNAWLGLALCQIRRGDRVNGLRHLEVAAAVEPQRALLRSYLAKGYSQAGQFTRAADELALARRLDPDEPTAWFYSALLLDQQNRPIEAIRDLEESRRLNDHRQLHRSRLLLDQDRAVRGANLAALYQRAGLTNTSIGEAARAVGADYANSSAHLFLSESYNALRDPTRFNLRHETVWFGELLLAQLLAPVGAGPLAQDITAQEYSRFFEANGAHFSSDTEWRSDGQVREGASQFARFGNTAYAVDLDYQHNRGVRPNNELSRLEWFARIKHQLTARDSVMLLTKFQNYQSGDNYQYGPYTRPEVQRHFDFTEIQDPIAVAGYHRAWSPGAHTLLLGGRLVNEQRVRDPEVLIPRITFDAQNGVITRVLEVPANLHYESEFVTYTIEGQHLVQQPRRMWMIGGRYQTGRFDTWDRFVNLSNQADHVSADLDHAAIYSYGSQWFGEHVQITAGLSYDHLTAPRNFRHPPVSRGESDFASWNPKAALLWLPTERWNVRALYARSQGGVSYEESFRLEPTQLAGFAQSYRTIISESVVGSVTAPGIATAGAAVDGRSRDGRTYAGAAVEHLTAEVGREVGMFQYDTLSFTTTPRGDWERLDYKEVSVSAGLHRLFGEHWGAGVRYRYTRSELDRHFPGLPIVPGVPNSRERADLHHVGVHLSWIHPAGFFASVSQDWFRQNSTRWADSGLARADDDFFQANAAVGYRLPGQVGDLTLGLLNLTGSDYRLSPLNPHAELPRELVGYARLRFRF